MHAIELVFDVAVNDRAFTYGLVAQHHHLALVHLLGLDGCRLGLALCHYIKVVNRSPSPIVIRSCQNTPYKYINTKWPCPTACTAGTSVSSTPQNNTAAPLSGSPYTSRCTQSCVLVVEAALLSSGIGDSGWIFILKYRRLKWGTLGTAYNVYWPGAAGTAG